MSRPPRKYKTTTYEEFVRRIGEGQTFAQIAVDLQVDPQQIRAAASLFGIKSPYSPAAAWRKQQEAA